MANTKAKTTKATRSTKSTKSSGSKKGIFSKINFKSRSTQLIFTVLIFALVGGAWFTYRSFAFVGSKATVGAGTLTNRSPGAYPYKETSGSKSGATVMQLSDWQHVTWRASSYHEPGSIIKVCAVAKKTSPNAQGSLIATVNNGPSTHIAISNTDYATTCNNVGVGNVTGNPTIKYMYRGSGTVRVGSLTVEQIPSAINTPSPSATK